MTPDGQSNPRKETKDTSKYNYIIIKHSINAYFFFCPLLTSLKGKLIYIYMCVDVYMYIYIYNCIVGTIAYRYVIYLTIA